MRIRLRRFGILVVLVIPLVLGGGSTARSDSASPSGCCKVCTEGKACGDTCIARDKTCEVGPGCACTRMITSSSRGSL